MTAEQLWRWPGLVAGYRATLRQERPDRVIHTNWHHLLLLGPLLRRRDLYWVHDLFPAMPRYRRLVAWLQGRLEGFVCVSEAVAGCLRRLGAGDAAIQVIHNGIADPCAQPVDAPHSPGRFRVGIVGQVAAWKGHEDLLAAFLILRTAVPHAELHVFGTG